MRGRKPTPTALRQLHGNPRQKKMTAAIKLETSAPKTLAPPKWLTADQRAAWDYAVASAPRGVLKGGDRALLTAWIVAEDLHRQASEGQAREGGLLVKAPKAGMMMQSAYLPIINRQALIMARLASELGFSPASRPRIATAMGGVADPIDPPTLGRRGKTLDEFLAEDEDQPFH